MDTSSTTQWQQANMGDHHQVLMASNNSIITCANTSTTTKAEIADKKAKPQEHLNCPRCNSSNTKFCYYNNYSLTQPRYFCKTCRRYWTEGGSLRNVPVGGGSRKNKKSATIFSSSTSSSLSSSSKMINGIPDLNPPSLSRFSTLHGGQDLNLAFPASNIYMAVNSKSQNDINIGTAGQQNQNPSFLASGGFAFQELKPTGSGATQGFSVDGLGSTARYSNNFRVQERNILFPFGGEMKHVEADQNKVGQGNNNNNNNNTNPSGYWSGLLGGGSW